MRTGMRAGIAILFVFVLYTRPAIASPGGDDSSSSTSSTSSPSDPAGGKSTRENFLVLPYLALGGESDDLHFITGLTLHNYRSAPESVSVEVFDNDWEPLPVILNGESEMAGKTTWTIPAEDSRIFVMMHPSDAPIQGWIRISSADDSAIDIVTVIRAYAGDSLVMQTRASSSLQRHADPDLHLINFGGNAFPRPRSAHQGP